MRLLWNITLVVNERQNRTRVQCAILQARIKKGEIEHLHQNGIALAAKNRQRKYQNRQENNDPWRLAAK